MSAEVWRDCQNRTIQTCLTNRLFMQSDWLFMQKSDRWGMNPAKILSETSTEAVGSKPFSAYMVDNSSSASGAKMFSISENGTTPQISSAY